MISGDGVEDESAVVEAGVGGAVAFAVVVAGDLVDAVALEGAFAGRTAAVLEHLAQVVHLLLQELLLLDLLVPVDLAPQLVSQDHLALHLQPVDLLLEFVVLLLDRVVLLQEAVHALRLLPQLLVLLLQLLDLLDVLPALVPVPEHLLQRLLVHVAAETPLQLLETAAQVDRRLVLGVGDGRDRGGRLGGFDQNCGSGGGV